MQCSKCGKLNIGLSKTCSKCGYKLDNRIAEREYCSRCGKPLLFPDKPCPYCSEDNKKESYCSECNTVLKKGGLFSGIYRLDKLETLVLNAKGQRALCEKCYREFKKNSQEKINGFINNFKLKLDEIPVLTVENPKNISITKYCRVITAQSMVEIGDISEFIENKDQSSEINGFDKKLSVGEKTCIFNLRKKALYLGANTIIGCDIEYAQLSAKKPVFLVAIMGTAAVAEEFKVLTETEQKIFNGLFEENRI